MELLKIVLRSNAASCLVFGLVFLLIPESVAKFLSPNHPVPLLILMSVGIGLIINGLHLIWTSRQVRPSQTLILYFSVGDLLWVVGTAVLILNNIWITSMKGIIAAIAVSIGVGTFGILQMLKRKIIVN
ncbi:MAG: hypothetical protein GVY17_05140 [Cyanobacteria bacterium]|jgi:uncharacterized protein YjeT (DUF2065 family)|nr:hypothetical protein [Cyanobacteria bacterium GSL.Bin21]